MGADEQDTAFSPGRLTRDFEIRREHIASMIALCLYLITLLLPDATDIRLGRMQCLRAEDIALTNNFGKFIDMSSQVSLRLSIFMPDSAVPRHLRSMTYAVVMSKR